MNFEIPETIKTWSQFFHPIIMWILFATSASLVPYMQKGNDLARYSHISLNAILLALFSWQAITGVQIVQKIVGNL